MEYIILALIALGWFADWLGYLNIKSKLGKLEKRTAWNRDGIEGLRSDQNHADRRLDTATVSGDQELHLIHQNIAKHKKRLNYLNRRLNRELNGKGVKALAGKIEQLEKYIRMIRER